MKKNIIFLFISILLLTGCSANFDVLISNNTITQEISIYMPTDEITEKDIKKTIESMILEVEHDTEIMQNYRIVSDNKMNSLNARISNNINQHNFNSSLYFCYDNQNITYSNNILKIETSNYFNCFDKYSILDDVNINVTTGYKVLENNADKVDGNTYTWNITKSNKKGIKLTLDTTVDEIQEEEKQKEKLSKNLIFIVIGTLVLFAFGTVLFVFIKSNKNNKI